MPCIGKPSYTHEIIISLWLICYIQCEFSVPYLSIPGVAAHDRCNISHIFAFSFQFQCRCFPLIYITIFQKDSKRGNVWGRGTGCGVIIICFLFFLFFLILNKFGFIMIVISIIITIIVTTIIMVIFFIHTINIII